MKLKDSLSPTNRRALETFDSLPDAANVRAPVVAALEGASLATVWRRSKNGQLPAPSKIGGTTVWNVGQLRRARSAA